MLACRAVIDSTPTTPLARAWLARWPIWAEVALFLVLMFLYEWARGLVAVDDPARPLANAADIVAAQQSLGLLVEPDIHDWTQAQPVVKFLTTWFYTLGYTTSFVALFIWVWWRRRAHFAAFRNWFWTASFVAVVGYWLYPLAPPRHTDMGMDDPTREALKLGGSLEWFQPFRNEYAAMPSMHCGLAILVGATIFWMLRPSPWRWCGLLFPVAMIFTTMATANHWWLDAVGGAVVVAIAAVLIDLTMRGRPRPWRYPN